MPHLAIVTPSFRPDLERCELLAESVERFAATDFRHVVIVPRADLHLFRERVGCFGATVLSEEELLPSWLLRVPLQRRWQLTPRGYPVRGWVRQQVIKIGFAALSTADALLFADSDTCLVRPIGPDLVLRPGGAIRLFADPEDGNLPTHHAWYRGACRLLGLTPEDYTGFGFIGNLVPWAPEVARGLTRRLEEVNGRSWRWVLLHQRTLSEYVLYGIFVQKVLGFEKARTIPDGSKLVLEYWRVDELSDERLRAFVAELTPDQLAVHIQSKARYSFKVFAAAVRAVWQTAAAHSRSA